MEYKEQNPEAKIFSAKANKHMKVVGHGTGLLEGECVFLVYTVYACRLQISH